MLLILGIVFLAAIVTLLALMRQTRAGRNNAGIAMALDRFLPVYDFHEVHRIRINATPSRIFAALRDVTPDEIRLVQLLTAIRGLHTEAKAPLLAQMLRRNILLVDEPEKEIVVGLIGQPWVLAGKSFSPRIGSSREYQEFHTGLRENGLQLSSGGQRRRKPHALDRDARAADRCGVTEKVHRLLDSGLSGQFGITDDVAGSGP